jgi:hypothetical protein
MPNAVVPGAEASDAKALTPHSKALYEAGKALLIESMEVGREFCKFMVGSSAGAIPVYLGLLKFLLPERYSLTVRQALILTGPTLLFLLASAIFAIGYFPTSSVIALDLPEDIDRARTASIVRRRKHAFWGFVVFAGACLLAIAASIVAITQPIASGP